MTTYAFPDITRAYIFAMTPTAKAPIADCKSGRPWNATPAKWFAVHPAHEIRMVTSYVFFKK